MFPLRIGAWPNRQSSFCSAFRSSPSLIAEGPRTATVVAESELRCYGLTPWEFRPLVETNAAIAWKLVQATAKRLRDAEQRGT